METELEPVAAECPFDSDLFSKLIDLGLSGCCGVFALELQRAKGYDLIGFVDESDTVIHFCCKDENGELIDAVGRGLTLEEAANSYVHTGSLKMESFTVQEVEELVATSESLGAFDPPYYREYLSNLLQSGWWEIWETTGRKLLDYKLKSLQQNP